MATRPKSVGGLAVVACLTTLAACGGSDGGAATGGESGGAQTAQKKSKSIALLIPGTTGDGGFWDNSAAGVKEAAQQIGGKAQIVEAGAEPTKWQPALDDLVAGNADLIVTGTFSMVEMVEQAAAKNPNKKFVIFDAAVDPKNCGGCSNVFSITYRYDETGFLGGALAGLLASTPGAKKVNPAGAPAVGIVGGQEIGVIKDYIRGFEAGAKELAPNVKVLSAYANSFTDPAQGKAVAEDMIGQGADVLMSAAGGTDKGVFEAAAARDLWAIGNAKQQASSPKVGGVDTVVTAAYTDLLTSLKDAVLSWDAGKMPFGQVGSYGVKEGVVAVDTTPLYKEGVPKEVQTKMDQVLADLKAGKYDTALKAS